MVKFCPNTRLVTKILTLCNAVGLFEPGRLAEGNGKVPSPLMSMAIGKSPLEGVLGCGESTIINLDRGLSPGLEGKALTYPGPNICPSMTSGAEAAGFVVYPDCPFTPWIPSRRLTKVAMADRLDMIFIAAVPRREKDIKKDVQYFALK